MTDPTRPIDSEQTAEGVQPDAVGSPAEELERLRELLLGNERRDLGELHERIDTWELTPEEVADKLPEAVGLRTARDDSLGRALAPTLEAAISEAVQRNPQQIAQAIYPVLGPAVRKAISDTISGFVETLNRAIEHSLTLQGLKWRFEALRTGVPYAQIVLKHALVYRVEQVFLIHGESGLMLGHVALAESKAQDPDLVSGMLTAIRDFVADSFDATAAGGLRRFKVGELTVMVEAGPRANLAAVVRGEPPRELLGDMQAVLETIHLQFRLQLEEFDGDAATLEPAEPLLAGLLETVVATDRRETRSRAPRIVWVVAGVVLLALLFVGIRSHLSWREAVTALRAEPGLTLIDADHGLRRWSFEGLRDPLSRDPLVVLGELGVDLERVLGRWEPYLSFDSEILLARSEKALAPPAGVELTLADGVLIGRGTASARWALLAQSRAHGLAGISRLDLSPLEVTVPSDLVEVVDDIESRRILFAIGSARFSAESLALLDGLAPRLAALRREADAVGYRLGLELVGRTDSTGTEETNRQLSGRRADAVLAALMERGFEPQAVSVVGLGISDPLPDAEGTDAGLLNRSVSFSIALQGWGRTEGGV